jgi:hypothetical protein
VARSWGAGSPVIAAVDPAASRLQSEPILEKALGRSQVQGYVMQKRRFKMVTKCYRLLPSIYLFTPFHLKKELAV